MPDSTTAESPIRSGRRHSPRRIFLYGTRGIGKSTWASQSDRCIFIPTEDGVDDIACESFPNCGSFAEFMGRIGWLYTEPHDFANVAIDSMDWLERLIWRRVCEQKNCQTIEDIPYGKGYTFALPYWQEVVEGLTALQRSRGMAVTMIAHASIEKFRNPETDSYDRYEPALHHLAGDMLQEWATEVLFATYKVYTTETDEGFNRKRTKPMAAADRVLRTCERPAYLAKNRLNLPEELPLDYGAFAAYLNPAEPAAVS